MGRLDVTVRYVRQKASGFYWEPSRRMCEEFGCRPENLGKDPAKALARARELWAQAQTIKAGQKPAAAPIEGTVSWIIARYRLSNAWKELRPATQRGYGQALAKVEAWCGSEPIEGVTRKAVKVWQEELERRAPAFAAAILRVLRLVINHARDLGYEVADLNKLRLHTAGGNSEPWEDWEISAYLDEARSQGRQSMALAMMLAVCLGQREGDIIRLPRSAYDAREGKIYLRQSKTTKRLAIPALPELRREIALTAAAGTIFVISEKSGKPYGEHHFRHVHRRICAAAGISDARKFMHLRHTAATRLGAAGCSDEEIRSITGHKSRSVVAAYVKPDSTMAENAIARLKDHRKRTNQENSNG